MLKFANFAEVIDGRFDGKTKSDLDIAMKINAWIRDDRSLSTRSNNKNPRTIDYSLKIILFSAKLIVCFPTKTFAVMPLPSMTTFGDRSCCTVITTKKLFIPVA